jgi:hypothetical protein
LPFVLANDDEIGVARVFADGLDHIARRLEPACAFRMLPGFFHEQRRRRTGIRIQLQGDLGRCLSDSARLELERDVRRRRDVQAAKPCAHAVRQILDKLQPSTSSAAPIHVHE